MTHPTKPEPNKQRARNASPQCRHNGGGCVCRGDVCAADDQLHGTKPEPSAQDELRAAFEIEARKQGFIDDALTRRIMGDYIHAIAKDCWLFFQAGAQWQATRQAAPDSRTNGNSQEAVPSEPEFCLDHDGELCLDWTVGDASLSVSIGGHGLVSWAMLAGDKRAHGSKEFNTAAPSDLHAKILAMEPETAPNVPMPAYWHKAGFKQARQAAANLALVAGAAQVQSHESVDREKLLWCARTVRAIADLGRAQPLGDWYGQALTVVATLRGILGLETIEAAQVQTAVAVPDAWISISDRMPDEGEAVIDFAPSHGQPMRINGYWRNYDADQKGYGVTHWMPAPKPPEQKP